MRPAGQRISIELMSLYLPDCVYFDVVPPLQFAGSDAIRRNFLRWFNEYCGERDIVFVPMLHLDRGNRNGEYSGVWLRSTVCCQRLAGRWLIPHEHISLPIDWGKSGMVALRPYTVTVRFA